MLVDNIISLEEFKERYRELKSPNKKELCEESLEAIFEWFLDYFYETKEPSTYCPSIFCGEFWEISKKEYERREQDNGIYSLQNGNVLVWGS